MVNYFFKIFMLGIFGFSLFSFSGCSNIGDDYSFEDEEYIDDFDGMVEKNLPVDVEGDNSERGEDDLIYDLGGEGDERVKEVITENNISNSEYPLKPINTVSEDVVNSKVDLNLNEYKLYVDENTFNDNDGDILNYNVYGDFLFLSGSINSNTPSDLKGIFENNTNIKVIVMTYVGGSIDDEANLKASKFIRSKNITTYLPSKGLIASGGTDFFLSGVTRYVEDGASVGVHSWADSSGISGKDIPKSDLQHVEYLNYYDSIGISQDFYWFTLEAAPADDMYYMSKSEMKEFKIFNAER